MPGTLAAAAISAALIAHQVAGKALRDALFLSTFGAASLPYVMAGAAALSVVAVLGVSRSMVRRSPAKLMPIALAGSAVGLVLEWALGLVSPPAAAVAVYLHTTAFGPAMISIFWSLINERFDPHTAKRAVGWIASGGSLGGVLGALSVWRASSIIEPPALILSLATLHGACALATLLIRAPIAPEAIAVVASTSAETRSALGWLRKTPLLRHLGLLVMLSAVTSALLDYVFSARAAAAFGTGQTLLSFFALFWLAVSVLSFLFQVTLGRVAIEKVGVAANIAVLPGITIAGSALGLVVPGLMSTSVLRGAEAAHHNTLFRSAYELLYNPLDEARKRPTKALIDVGFDRFGTVVGSGIVIVALALAAQSSLSVLLAVVLVLAIASLPVAWRLHVHYRGALEQGMREGARGLDLPTIERESGSSAMERKELDVRDELIERVEALRPGGLAELTATEGCALGPAYEALRHPQPLIAHAAELLSGDVERTRRALGAWPGTSRPVADLAILLLAHDDPHHDALLALRRIAPLITGQLVDALLDPAMDFIVRRRIPRVLVACESQRAADGLVAGIRDERFEVRYECGRALMQLTHRNADIVVSPEWIVEAIVTERDKGGDNTSLEIDAREQGEPETLVELLVGDRIDRSLEHVFTILSLHHEREPLRMAFRALHHEDVRHRGTALEYLNTVLSTELHDAVWPLLGKTGPLSTPRPAEAILADLARATSGSDLQTWGVRSSTLPG